MIFIEDIFASCYACFQSLILMSLRTMKQFILNFAVLLGGLALNYLMLLVHAQSQSGFISIDCGLVGISSYCETNTGINYVSDTNFIDTGENNVVSFEYSNTKQQPYESLRSFPQGSRNCYKINVTSGTRYLIRATFVHGNYDGRNELPAEFELHLGPNLWDSVKPWNGSIDEVKEVIHVSTRSYIHVCLVNTDSGVPFISAIELRTLPSDTYETQQNQSMALVSRYDTGVIAKRNAYRYPADIHDRFWQYYNYNQDDWTQLNTSSIVDFDNNNSYQPPSDVMRTAATPKNRSDSLVITFRPLYGAHRDTEYYSYLHFAEVEKLRPNQSRLFYTRWDGGTSGPIAPEYLDTTTIFSRKPWRFTGEYFYITITAAHNSTLPPILNAFEIYMAKKFLESETNQHDVDAITNMKLTYKIGRNWQGDPCAPQKYSWEGLKCSYNDNHPPRIISLDLSSSGLTGEIAPSISNLTMIQTLDLSNNNLTGPIPDFLSQFQNLTVINLEKNNFIGSIPEGLIKRRNSGLLKLSLCDNPNLQEQVSCKKEHNIIFQVLVSIVGIVILLLTVAAISWGIKRKRQHEIIKNFKQNGLMESQGKRFTYSEIVKITNNFASMIGSGGFGKVYHGILLKNEIQVAVKLLTSSSRQGSKEFQNEVQLLMRAHHRNLVSLVGYCDEGETMSLVYEYVANGNLQQLLSADVTTNVLTWKERLQIAVDAARGLDYLHNGCKPPIVHRDLKTSNILLNEKLQAKIADFGLSRGLGTESVTHVSTGPKGTFGYLDPEYFYTGSLNKKSDIYSFGIVLLELITGREAIIKDVEALPIHICQWVSPKFESTEIENIVDSRIQGTYNISSAWKAIEIAMACLLPTASQRPDIIVVYNNLKECLEIEMPSEIWKIMENNENDSEGNIDDTSSNSSIIMASHIEIETERHTT